MKDINNKFKFDKINDIYFNEGEINSVKISNDKIFVANDNSIIIYDKNNFKILQALKNQHEENAYDILIENNNFITSTFQRLYFYEYKKEKKVFYQKYNKKCHSRLINKLALLSNGNLITCGLDEKTIKIWEKNDKNDYQCITILYHFDWVQSFLVLEKDNLFISVGEKNTKFWNLNNFQIIKEFDKIGCYRNNSVEKINNKEIIIGGVYNYKMYIISIKDKIKRKKEIDNKFICLCICAYINKQIFLVGGHNFKINVYQNFDNYKLINYINAHSDYIVGITKLNDNLFISYSFDKFIRIWKINIK